MAVLPVPTILPSGESVMVDHEDYFPGDPLPEQYSYGFTRNDSRLYTYNKAKDAYIPDTTHVLPVKVRYPDGSEGPVELSWWWPGDPYPNFRQRGTLYVYDAHRGVYVRSGAEHKPARGGVATAGGAWFAARLLRSPRWPRWRWRRLPARTRDFPCHLRPYGGEGSKEHRQPTQPLQRLLQVMTARAFRPARVPSVRPGVPSCGPTGYGC